MRFLTRMPALTRLKIKKTLGFLAMVLGTVVLINFIPIWVWPAILGIWLVAWGWTLLSRY